MSAIDHWMKESFQISRKTYSETFGSEPYVSIGSVMGFLQPVTGRLSQRSGKEAAEVSATLYTKIDSDIRPGDRVTDADGHVWIANFVQPKGISGLQNHQEIPLELTS